MNDPLGLFGDEQSNDPLGLFEEPKKAGWGTAIKSSLASAVNSADAAISLPAGALANYLGFQEQGDAVFKAMEERAKQNQQWANPENAPLSTTQQIGGTLITAPAQVLGMFGAPAMKGTDLIQRGEDLSTAIPATAIETGMNVAGVGPMQAAKSVLGRAAIGAGANMAFGAGADAATQLLAKQEATKQAYDPYDLDRRLVEGVTGGVLQAAFGERPTTPRSGSSKVNSILEQDAAAKGKQPEPTASGEPGQLPLFDDFEMRSPISPYQTEMAPNMWRVDENGIPIRADLSMEAQNLQQPLQRNLFGDELDANFPRDPNKPLSMETGDITGVERFSDPVSFRNDPENQRPLTEAIDIMEPNARTAALEQTRMGRELPASPELEVARMDAERLPAEKPLRIKGKKQSGYVDPDVFLKDFPEFVTSKIKDVAGKLKLLFRGVKEDYTSPDRPMLGTLGEGIYLTESKTMANNYARGGTEGRQVRAYYADVKNPYVMEIGSPEHGDLLLSDRQTRKAFSDRVKAEGYDGVVVKAGDELKEVMVFSPEQAKNAFTAPSKQGFVPKSQRGGVLFDWGTTTKVDNAEVTLDGSLIPKNPVVEDAISAALKQGKDGKQWNYMQSGSTSVAMKTGSPIVKAASEIVQNAVKRADLAIRNYIFPTEAAFRKLSKVELTDLAEIMKAEMLKGERIDGDVLARNLSIKQLEAYTRMRDMFDKTLDAQNAVRVAQGKKPISAHEAYMSSRWQGDFRQPVYDGEGNLVWYLAANTKKGLELQATQLKKVAPGVVIDPAKAHVVKSSHMGTDLQSAYTTMLDILDPQRDKAAIQELKAAIEDQLVSEGELTLAQEKHFKRKSGVRGYAGDRPWMDASKDALDMFQQQIQYAKNAFKWSEMQQVSKDIGAIVSNEQLQQQQPNNIKYIREYYKNAIGMGEAQVTRALNDAMRDGLGVSPNLVSQAVGNMKSFFITQKLAVSAGYTLSNLIQAGNVLPYLSDLAGQGIRGNPLTSIPTGVLGGMAMAVSHYMKSLGSEYINQLPNQFFKDAFRYAEENGVTARSVYDEAPLDTGFSPSKKALRVAGQTMAVPETFVRSVAFMTYAQWLKESGKFTDQMKLFQKAEELVNMSMVDYRETERPLMFAKAGAAGNFLNTLQTYPMSFYNQWSYMLKQASKGNLAGLGAMMAFQFAVAGAMGLPGFEDMDKLYKWIRDNAVSTETWNKMMKSPVFSDPKMWMIDTFGQSSVYGYLSDKTGIGLTSRVAAPGAGAMLQSPVGPIVDIAKQVGAVGSAVADPTNKQKVAEAALKVVPVGLQGFLETQPFMEGITFNERPDGTRTYMKNSDLSDRRGGYTRTPDEDAVRAWGIRSQKEVLTRDVAYATNSANQALTKKASELIDQYYNAVRLGNTEKAKKLATLYMDISGKEITDVQFENQIKEEFYNDVEKANTKGMTPRQLMNAAKMNKLLESK